MKESHKLRKKASLTPKILNALLSNVKESFYLIDNTNIRTPQDRSQLINSQIETLLDSKLYGSVILIGLRKLTEL